VMLPDEMMVDISFPAMETTARGTFIKLALRRAQAISIIDVAVILDTSNSTSTGSAQRLSTGIQAGSIKSAAIALGAVAPTIIRVDEAEQYLVGKKPTNEVFEEAARLTMNACNPIDDIRGSAVYRNEMVRVCTLRGLKAVRDRQEQAGMPVEPILLWGEQMAEGGIDSAHSSPSSPIETTINGKKHTFQSGHDKTLLRFLREEANLIGTKEGCAEGECGACTVFLDSNAVMACLVPAPRAHGAEIITVEGLASLTPAPLPEGKLHPVQEAFIEYGAVQCGYCTPGFLMSAAKLLEEKSNPTRHEIEQAITGNLCRCTGYYKIVEAIHSAATNASKEQA
jgi:xanthine dehydrogenase iron-sulfur cluster and FAD-binding subunit A